MKKSILITGASGFVGAHLFRKLLASDSYRLHLLFEPGSNWRLRKSELQGAAAVFEVDLTQPGSVKKAIDQARPELVYHLAAAGVSGSVKRWQRLIRTNVLGVVNLLSALSSRPPKHFIQMGTCFEYGARFNNMKETDPLNPMTIYSASKVSSTFLALTIGRTLGIPVTVFRAFTLYGPFDNSYRLVSWVILSLLRGEYNIRLTEGKKEQVKDFLYADDFVSFLEKFQQAVSQIDPYQIFNIGHHEPVSVEQLINRIAHLMNKRVSIIDVSPEELPFAARATEYPRVVSDSSKARRLLGWRPRTSLNEGLKATIDWFKQNQKLYSYE